MGISRTCAHRWLKRYRAAGWAGLEDRSSRPESCPHATPANVAACPRSGRSWTKPWPSPGRNNSPTRASWPSYCWRRAMTGAGAPRSFPGTSGWGTSISTRTRTSTPPPSTKDAGQRIARYGRVDLLCIDELGYMELDRRGAELLFQVLTEREEKNSISIASNESFSGWTKTFTDPRLCAAIVDRLTFNGAIIETGTDSYRLAHTKQHLT
jgi:hypothetical protein